MITPAADISMPANCLMERASWPSTQAAMAATTGISAENMLDLATPRFLMVLTHRENAMLEQNTPRQTMGYHTSMLMYFSQENPSSPLKRKRGSR